MLKVIPGGPLNAEKLMNHLLDATKSVKRLGNNTANIVISNLLSKTINYIDFPKPLKYFRVTTAQCFMMMRIVKQ